MLVLLLFLGFLDTCWLVAFLLTQLLQMCIKLRLFLLGQRIRLVISPTALNPVGQFLLEEVEFVASLSEWYAPLGSKCIHGRAFLADELAGLVHRHHHVFRLTGGRSAFLLPLIKAANHLVHLDQQLANRLGQLVKRQVVRVILHIQVYLLVIDCGIVLCINATRRNRLFEGYALGCVTLQFVDHIGIYLGSGKIAVGE